MSRNFYDGLSAQKPKILQGLVKAAARKGSPFLTEHLYKPGQDVFYAGTEPFGVHYIHSGAVKLFKSGKAGRQHSTYLGGRGDLFGYRSLLAGELYKVTAECLVEARIAFIEKGFFLDHLRKDKLLCHLLLRSLSVELGEVEDRLVGAVQVRAEQRVARVLCFLMDHYGVRADGFLNLEMSRTDMSELCDTAPETLMRYLGYLEGQKLIHREKKNIKILDPKALRREAGTA